MRLTRKDRQLIENSLREKNEQLRDITIRKGQLELEANCMGEVLRTAE